MDTVTTADTISVLDERVAEMSGTAVVDFAFKLSLEMRAMINWLESKEMEDAARIIGQAAANTLADNAKNVKKVKAACEAFGRALFPQSVYGELWLLDMVERLSKVDGFEDTKFGANWWMAVTWAFADDLIPLREAAEISNTKMPNISQSSKLVFFVNPESNLRQDRRLVLRSQVIEIWGDHRDGEAA